MTVRRSWLRVVRFRSVYRGSRLRGASGSPSFQMYNLIMWGDWFGFVLHSSFVEIAHELHLLWYMSPASGSTIKNGPQKSTILFRNPGPPPQWAKSGGEGVLLQFSNFTKDPMHDFNRLFCCNSCDCEFWPYIMYLLQYKHENVHASDDKSIKNESCNINYETKCSRSMAL